MKYSLFNLTKLLGIENSKQFEARKSELIKKFEPQFISKEKTYLRIYYPKDEKQKLDLFLFNNQENKEQFVLTRNYFQENDIEKYKVITDLVDDKFLPLITIMQLFDLKQTYIIESDIYKLGDLTIEFSKMYLDKEKNKFKFIFCVNNMYGHTFLNTHTFTEDVMSNFFDEVDEKKIVEACDVNKELLEKYNLYTNTGKGLEEEYYDNLTSERFPKIKLIQYLLYLK